MLQERQQREAALTERQRIADELHDVIAHDLTVIAMYSRVLEQPIDTDLHAQAHQTIKESADKALRDLRRVVDRTQQDAVLVDHPHESLGQAIECAQSELHGVGSRLLADVSLPPHGLPRVLDRAMARIVRESMTNALKYGAAGEVRLTIAAEGEAVTMGITSPLPTGGRQTELPSGGYGIVRMKARASQLGGELEAAPSGPYWRVQARFPIL